MQMVFQLKQLLCWNGRKKNARINSGNTKRHDQVKSTAANNLRPKTAIVWMYLVNLRDDAKQLEISTIRNQLVPLLLLTAWY